MLVEFIDENGQVVTTMDLTLNELQPKDRAMAVSRQMLNRLFADTDPVSSQLIFVEEDDGSISLAYPRTKAVFQNIGGEAVPMSNIRANGQVVWEAEGH